MAVLALVSLVVALVAFHRIRTRERRLRRGEAGLHDLVAFTGITDRQRLARLPGVLIGADGAVRLDPGCRQALPCHPLAAWLDSPIGNGLCISASIAALGMVAEGAMVPPGLVALTAAAALYQLLGRIWSLALWLEARDSG